MGRAAIIGDRNGRVWPQVLRMAEESRQAGRAMVLYVPEQYTLQAERDLITGLHLPGLLDLRVISPRKLRQQVRERMGTGTRPLLGEFGRAMAVHRAMTEKAEELRYYREMTDLPGAVKRVEEALGELRESDMDRDRLREYIRAAETGAERAKLSDLEILRDSYEALITEHFDDEKTVWTDMVARLARSGMWEGADLAVYGFDSIRPDLRELLAAVCGQVHSLRVFLTMDRREAPDGHIFFQQRESVDRLQKELEERGYLLEEIYPGGEREGSAEALRWLDRNLFARAGKTWTGDTGGALGLYAGASPWEEAGHAAETLLKWHGEGMAWNRMAVALAGENEMTGMLRAALSLNGIPFQYQQKDRASDHPVCRMLLSALACLGEGYRTDRLMDVARSGYSTLNEEEGLALADYARARGIEGRRWQKPFTAGEGAAAAEKLRVKLLQPLEELRTALREARSADASAEALVWFLEKERVREKLQAQETELLEKELFREAVVNRQVWKMLMDLLDQLWTLLGGRRAAIGDLSRMLSSALEGAGLSSLPEQEEGVIIGRMGHLLAGEVEGLILPGAQDGLLAAEESGWLADPERRRLEEFTGAQIGLDREKRSLIRKYDCYRTLTLPSRRLMISWSLRGEDGGALQPDGLITEIREMFPDVKAGGGLTETEGAGGPATPRAALDGLGPRLRALKNGEREDLTAAWKNAMVSLMHSGIYGETARQMLAELLPPAEKARLAQETARQLFMTDNVSISRLESFAGCPYRHFIDYGLRPVQQETFDFQSDEAGTFFHEALDRYMKQAARERGWPDLTEEQVDRMMDGILDSLTEEWQEGPLRDGAIGWWQGETYVRRVRHAARVLTRFAGNSDFRTIATELDFGPGGTLPAIEMTLRDGSRTAIRGKIDRIDTWESGEGVWLRVVDNKSREKKPEAAKMADGEQLQLMIYLKAAAKAMPGTRLAGAFFFPVEDREVSVDEDDPEAIEAARMKNVRMNGLAAAREDVIHAMDRDISPYSLDKVFNKDGTVGKNVAWAVEEETLEALTDAAVRKAGELCERIREGEIQASPSSDGKQSVCRYCDYRGICHVRKGDERIPDPGVTFRDIARKAGGDEAGKNTLHESEK